MTAHWLNDVLMAKVMSPPSNPLHLPVPFKDKVPECRNMVSNTEKEKTSALSL